MEPDAAAVTGMLAWLRANGAQLDAVLWPAVFPNGRGVAASRDLKPGDEVLRIPDRVMLVPDRCRKPIEAMLVAALGETEDGDAVADLLDDDYSVLALHVGLMAAWASDAAPAADGLDDGDAALAATLEQQRPYACCLPPMTDVPCMRSEWSAGEAAWLADEAAAQEARESKRGMLQAYALLGRALARFRYHHDHDDHRPSMPAAPLAARLLARFLTWPRWRWCCYAVRSRAHVYGFAVDEAFMMPGVEGMLPIALVPLADMLNHDAPGMPGAAAAVDGGSGTSGGGVGHAVCECDWVPAPKPRKPTTGKKAGAPSLAAGGAAAAAAVAAGGGASAASLPPLPPSKGDFVVRATAAIPAGCEVLISYGDRSTGDLIENYGFTLPFPGNGHEAVAVPLGRYIGEPFADTAEAAAALGPSGGGASSLLDVQAQLEALLLLADDDCCGSSSPVQPPALVQRVRLARLALWQALGGPGELELTSEGGCGGGVVVLEEQGALAADTVDATGVAIASSGAGATPAPAAPLPLPSDIMMLLRVLAVDAADVALLLLPRSARGGSYSVGLTFATASAATTPVPVSSDGAALCGDPATAVLSAKFASLRSLSADRCEERLSPANEHRAMVLLIRLCLDALRSLLASHMGVAAAVAALTGGAGCSSTDDATAAAASVDIMEQAAAGTRQCVELARAEVALLRAASLAAPSAQAPLAVTAAGVALPWPAADALPAASSDEDAAWCEGSRERLVCALNARLGRLHVLARHLAFAVAALNAIA